MTPHDQVACFALLADVYAFYGKDFSRFAGETWWRGLKPYDLTAVKEALGRHCVNPDTGQFLPKPGDVVRMLEGSTQDTALRAWAQVDRTVQAVGIYESVVFDDALIHRSLHDMGGWIFLGSKTEKDWPFVRNEFVNRYRGYRMRSARPDYPHRLIGLAEAQNTREGLPIAPPILIGDVQQAKQVMAGGTPTPLLTLTRLDPEEMSPRYLSYQEAA